MMTNDKSAASPQLLLQSSQLQILVVQLPLENGRRLPQGCLQFPPPGVLGASAQPQLLNSPHQFNCIHNSNSAAVNINKC